MISELKRFTIAADLERDQNSSPASIDHANVEESVLKESYAFAYIAFANVTPIKAQELR